jgi:hypothetical protein
MRHSRFNDGHRSKLLISHLHTRRTVVDPVLPLLGIPTDVRRRIVIAVHDVAAVTAERSRREIAHLAMQRAAHAAGLAGREPRIAFDDPPPAPVGLVGDEAAELGHSGVSNRQGKMPVLGHTLHVQRLDLDDTGLGCQPVRKLM